MNLLKDKLFWTLFLISAVLILGNIGTGSLSGADEAVYADISQNILHTHNWLTLQAEGKLWFEKPPLYMWCTAVFYQIFGINEFSVRLTASLLGIGTLLLVYLLGSKLWNCRSGFFGALTLLAMPHFLLFCKQGMMDVPLTFFTVLMFYLFWLGKTQARYLFLSGLVFFLAYFTKGFAAFIGPFVITPFLLFDKEFRKHSLLYIGGLLAATTLIFFWHYCQYLISGPQALKAYFDYQILQRATESIESHSGGILYYFDVIKNKAKPGSIFGIIALIYSAYLALRYRDKANCFIVLWALIVFTLYTSVQTKLPWYIMPIYPALALSFGFLLAKILQGRFLKITSLIILSVICIKTFTSSTLRLDFNPAFKKAFFYGKTLQQKGSHIYWVNMNFAGRFYAERFAAGWSDTEPPTQELIQKGNVYLFIPAEHIDFFVKKRRISLGEIHQIDNLIFAQLK